MTLHAWWLNMNLRSTVSEGKQAPAPPWSFCLKREGQGPWGVGSAAGSALQHQKSLVLMPCPGSTSKQRQSRGLSSVPPGIPLPFPLRKRMKTPGTNCLTTLVREKTKKAEGRTTAGGVRQQRALRAAATRPPPGLQTWTLPFRATATFFWECYPQRPCHNLPQTLILSKMQSPLGRWLWPPPTSPLGPILQRSPRSSQRVAEERWEKVRGNLILGFCACCLWLLLPASALSRDFSWAPPSLLIPRPKCHALLTLSTVISNIPYELKNKTSPATSIAEVQWPTLRQ